MSPDNTPINLKDLMDLQQRLQDTQFESVRKQLESLLTQAATMQRGLEAMAIQQAVIEGQIHGTPCPQCRKVGEDVTYCQQHGEIRIPCPTVKELKTTMEVCNTKIEELIEETRIEIKQELKAHEDSHYKIWQLVLAILGSAVSSAGLLFALLKVMGVIAGAN